jgi:hypothetical protein
MSSKERETQARTITSPIGINHVLGSFLGCVEQLQIAKAMDLLERWQDGWTFAWSLCLECQAVDLADLN